MILQVLTLMVRTTFQLRLWLVAEVIRIQPLRTIMNYQYRYGTTTTQATRILWDDGGFGRYYRGLGPALIQGSFIYSLFRFIQAHDQGSPRPRPCGEVWRHRSQRWDPHPHRIESFPPHPPHLYSNHFRLNLRGGIPNDSHSYRHSKDHHADGRKRGMAVAEKTYQSPRNRESLVWGRRYGRCYVCRELSVVLHCEFHRILSHLKGLANACTGSIISYPNTFGNLRPCSPSSSVKP